MFNDDANSSLFFNEELMFTKYDTHSVYCINEIWFTEVLL